ncbi:DUF3307 domain-containing protein [Olleya marilimosa]|uniref:DUF3307 domain-containing protein n=1 Tax=Olleya marilimosa TaxID=272164 RepID=A0ABR8LUM4_9FLAO|nr:DUF3307 domain-containing protein [Olleya marilimosa]MBD3861908.1 DUF3307 domain-containing protein [Olleya marilimosa]MBD3889408.1 DUF3307 domain-containing protein [Olleya marilimosa]
MMLLVLKLVLAHAIGDFVLQPDQWVKDKTIKKHKSKYLYFHVLIHALALLILLQFNANYWIGIVSIVVSHYIIDVIKLNLTKKINPRLLFILDQIAHLIVIAIVALTYTQYSIDINTLYSKNVLALLLSLIAITSIASVIMRLVMSKWILDEDDANDSLEKAGKYIGILERLFVFGFIIINQWSAIGLLIAAKSVFRFGDLSKAKDRKLTEYILIGTLLSFGIAISVGLLYNFIIA